MDFKMIEALLLSTQGFTGSIDAEYLNLKRAKDSSDKLRTELEKAGVRRENMTEDLEGALVLVESEYERQGFISGFRMGVKLMSECTYQLAGGDPI